MPGDVEQRTDYDPAAAGETPSTTRARLLETVRPVFAAAGIQMLKTPPRTPKANAFAERWVRTVQTECLDWILVRSRRHLERVPTDYRRHYNTARPHRGINLDVPAAPIDLTRARTHRTGRVDRVDVLGGLIHEFGQAA